MIRGSATRLPRRNASSIIADVATSAPIASLRVSFVDVEMLRYVLYRVELIKAVRKRRRLVV